jgi:hypothetical protein
MVLLFQYEIQSIKILVYMDIHDYKIVDASQEFKRIVVFTATKRHNSHAVPFHSSNRPELVHRYSDHAVTVVTGGPTSTAHEGSSDG